MEQKKPINLLNKFKNSFLKSGKSYLAFKLIVQLLNYFSIKYNISPGDKKIIFDIGSGTGMLGIPMALEVPKSTIYGLEPNRKAFYWTAYNSYVYEKEIAKKESIFHPIELSASEAVRDMSDLKGTADVVMSSCAWVPLPKSLDFSNMPYGVDAVYAGEDGLDMIREVVSAANFFLKPGGMLFMTTPVIMFDRVKPLLSELEWSEITQDSDDFLYTKKI